jgi:hypothetical protein
MFFTYAVRYVAILGLGAGILWTALGFGIATGFFGPYEEALKRDGGSAASSGEMIDRGLYITIVSLALGVLADISYGIRR